MDSIRTICSGITYTFATVGDFLQEIVACTYRGAKRALEISEVTATRIITADQNTLARLAIEHRSDSQNGSVKRRCLERNKNTHNIHERLSPRQQSLNTPNFSISSAIRANRARNPRISPPQLHRARKSPSQLASARRQIGSTDFTAGINLDLEGETKLDPSASIYAAEHASHCAFVATLKTQHFDLKIPGTTQYGSKYDLVSKPRRQQRKKSKRTGNGSNRHHPYGRPQYKKAEPTNSQTKLRFASSEQYQLQKSHRSSSKENPQDGRSRIIEESQAALGIHIEAERAVHYATYKEEEAARNLEIEERAQDDATKLLREQVAQKAKDDAEREESLRLQEAKVEEDAAKTAQEEQHLEMELAAKLQTEEQAKQAAIQKVRKEAELKYRQEAIQRKAAMEAAEDKAYAERTAMVEEEDDDQNETALEKRNKRKARDATNRRESRLEEAYQQGWRAQTEDEKAAALEEETKMKTKANEIAQSVATPEQAHNPSRLGLHVQYKISPNSGFEAVSHMMYDRTAPPTELIPPERPWPRAPFFVRPFDIFMRDAGNKHPAALPPGASYGLERQYNEYDAVIEEAHDTSIEMTDASPLQAPDPVPVQAPVQAPVPNLFQGPVLAHVSATVQGLFNAPTPPAAQVPAVPAVPVQGSLDIETADATRPQVGPGANTVTNGTHTTTTTNGAHLQGSSHSADSTSRRDHTASTNPAINGIHSYYSTAPSAFGSSRLQFLPPSNDELLKDLARIKMSKLSIGKVTRVREAKRVDEAKKQAEEAAAAARAKAEAERAARLKAAEEARIAMEKADAEARAAEEERKKKGGRRMPTEKFVRPLCRAWEARLNAEMKKGRQAPVATTSSGATLRVHDFLSVLTPGSWLNDEIINAYLELIVDEANQGKPPGSQKFVTMNSFFYSNLSKNGPQSVRRWLNRKKVGGEKMLDLDAIFIPVNQGSHWTLIVVSPKARTIEYLNSFVSSSTSFIRDTKAWLALELGQRYVEEEWTVPETACARQYNTFDCGVFAITNAKCISLGLDPTCYDDKDMATQRRRIAAEIINKGSIV